MKQGAIEAAHRAYAPYSRFAVGAAVLSDDGRIHTGANVENASFGLSICAERNAIFRAVADGARRIEALRRLYADRRRDTAVRGLPPGARPSSAPTR